MQNNKQKSKIDPWQERFAWYHYTLDQIFTDTDEDLARTAADYQASGITSIILFGTHFRYSFWAYWSDIADYIARFTKACHALDLKVIEHHSSHLTYRLQNTADWKKSLALTSVGPAVGPLKLDDFLETSQANPVLAGAHLDDFAQMDGSTGQPALSSYIHTEGKNMDWLFKHYNGNAHCFNHPAYKESYWQHIQEIITKANIDGIMNDDVQWFGGGNTCSCQHCRSLFKEEYGFDLPEPADWLDFFEDYDNGQYLAWKKFKKKSSGDFHRWLDGKYQSIGFMPLRPAYCAEVLPFDTTCYGFEAAAELWDYIFQECCGIIRYSYVCFAGEAIHRYAMAQRYGVPPMALLYPRTEDSMYAAWALCRSWGQMYTGTGGLGSELHDKVYRQFEENYALYLDRPSKQADLAFYFSESTRDYSDQDAPQKYQKPYMSYLESAYVSGLMPDMVFRTDSLDQLAKAKLIVLPYIAVISDSELATLRSYVENGGRLIILGPFASRDENGRRRRYDKILAQLGLKTKLLGQPYRGKELLDFAGRSAEFGQAVARYVLEPAGDIIARGDNGEVLAVKERLGQGYVIVHPGDVSENPIQAAIWPRGATPVDASVLPRMRQTNGRLLEILSQGKKIEHDLPDLQVSLFTAGGATSIHLVNTRGMLPQEDAIGTTEDPIPAFVAGAKKLAAFSLRLHDWTEKPTRAWLASPEQAGRITVETSLQDDTLVITVPDQAFAGYGLLVLEYN